jgi:non-ribosomal peptide synthetase component F
MSGRASASPLPDLDSPARIRAFIEAFYARVLADERLAPIFLDVAAIDLAKHLPIICSYWEKLILGADGYRRHTMNIHRALNARQTSRRAPRRRACLIAGLSFVAPPGPRVSSAVLPRPPEHAFMPARHFNLADLFEIVADTVPEREALVCGDARLTYAQLEERANRLAHYLAAQGIGAGDKVGLYLYNCNEYLEGMLACFKVRAVPVNVNYRYVDEELSYILDNAQMAAASTTASSCRTSRQCAPPRRS